MLQLDARAMARAASDWRYRRDDVAYRARYAHSRRRTQRSILHRHRRFSPTPAHRPFCFDLHAHLRVSVYNSYAAAIHSS